MSAVARQHLESAREQLRGVDLLNAFPDVVHLFTAVEALVNAIDSLLRPAPSSADLLSSHTVFEDDYARVHDTLRSAFPDQLTRTAINRQVFSGHRAAKALDRILRAGQERGRFARTTVQTSGRPRSCWRFIPE